MEKIILTNLNSDDLKKIIRETVEETISGAKMNLQTNEKSHEPEELLSRKQVSQIYNVSFVTLRDWEKNKIIPRPIRRGTRVYWRKSDIIENINNKGGKYGK